MLRAMTQPEVAEVPVGNAPVRRRRWLPWAAIGTVVLLVAGAAVWWSFWSARAVWPGDGAFGISVPSTEEDRVFAFGSMSICLEGVDSAVIEGVEVEAGNASVTDFGVRPHPEPADDGIVTVLGSQAGHLADTGLRGGRSLRSRCGDASRDELGIEVTRAGPGTARADGLLVHWSSGIRSGTVRIPAHFVLCAGRDTSAPSCASMP
jgi:hypothetical protein